MKSRANSIREFILKEVSKHPHDLVIHIMTKFKVSRTTALRHIQYLVTQNKLTKTGNTKQITYTLTADLNKKLTITLNDSFDEYDFFSQFFSKILKNNLNAKAFAICEYVMTELLNNCRDHSKGNKTTVHTYLDKHVFHCIIEDNGEGLFKTIQDSSNWSDMRDIIFELSKGKLTRDPMNHSGEGVFFSSRVVDRFEIVANGYQFIRDNLELDWTFCESDSVKGTRIEIEIDKDTDRQLAHVFENYTEDFSFNKTDILVDLSKHYGERLISRSQAKRVCRRLESFSHVTLDFKKIESVGQGFVDQVFRVYQNENQHIVIEYINANSSVEFMIKRCLAMLDGSK